MQITATNPVILFDGVCNLCNGAVQFVIKRDKKNIFKYASLQSNFGQNFLSKSNLPQTEFNSFILLDDSKFYTRSTGALMVAKHLTGGWPLVYGFIIIPPFLRNGIYNFISRNRYKWFGKQDTCWLPTPDLKNKFL